MADVLVEFEWWRDPKGYRLREAKRVKNPLHETPRFSGGIRSRISLFSALEHLTEPAIILRNGGALESYRPLEKFGDLLPREFAKVSSADDLVNFVRRFGPLTKAGLKADQGDQVDAILEEAGAMRWLIDLNDKGAVGREMTRLKVGAVDLGAIGTKLVLDPATESVRLQLRVTDMMTAIWIQFGHLVSGGATIKKCQHCGGTFTAGPRTGRTLKSRFCKDDCRIQFNSLERTRKKGK